MATIRLTPQDPSQTVTAPGAYAVDIAAGTLTPVLVFSGPGPFTVTGVTGTLSAYTIEATAGAAVTIDGLGTVASLAILRVDGTASIDLASGLSPYTVVAATFTGTGAGTLRLAPGLLAGLNTAPVITGFGANDRIELGGTTGDGATYATSYAPLTHTLTLLRNGAPAGSVTLAGAYSASNFSIATDGSGHVEIAYIACFLRGTRIMTPTGPQPIESLAPGDRVSLADGGARPVRWIGRRAYAPAMARRNPEVMPVLIRAGALADGVPMRDLLVSPRHAMRVQGSLVHAIELVNGHSILHLAEPPAGEAIVYLHLELDEHAVILAEGAPTESYVECGNRQVFHNAATHTPDPAAPPARFCAPVIDGGPLADAARLHLAVRAGLAVQAAGPSGPLCGHLDHAGPGLAHGWAMDAGQPGAPLLLHILQNGERIATLLADRYRPDLLALPPDRRRHGFRLAHPALTGGPIQVVRAADGAELHGSAGQRRAA